MRDLIEGLARDENQECKLAKYCLDFASVCIFRVNQDGRIVYANRNACDTLGYSHAELLQLSVFDIDPIARPEIWHSMWEKLCAEGSITAESQHIRKDGSIFPIELTVTLIDIDGQHFSMGITKDISERKQLYDSLQMFQFIFDEAPLGIYLIKEGGSIAYVNDHACRYLGYTKKELSRMHVADIDDSHRPDEIEKIWSRQKRSRRLETFETIHRKKDGTQFPVEISGIALEFNGDLYSVSFCKDISDRKEAEKKRLKMEAHLRETQKMESLGTLAGGIAHDFNNILGAIIGYAELTQIQCQEGSKLEKYVSQISKAGNRAAELVKQILWFSRQGLEEKRPLEISRVVKDALKLIEVTLPATVEIIKKISPDLPPVLGNEIQIHQIVMNLCTNAYHAIKKSNGTLGVSLVVESIHEQDVGSFPGVAPGDYIKLSVSDDGCGIPPEVINRIFEPYFTTKPVGEGTGLGLSTVHGIIKDHGGCIQVYSEVGTGTTFDVLFPVIDAETILEARDGEGLPTGGETILFVDDEKVLIDLVHDLLERLGYKVETRASSIDAAEAFKGNPMKYDLILSDVTMPKMAGDELAQHIKAIRPDIPIILCSGFSNRINEQTMETLGIDAMLMKPMIYSELAHTIRRVLDKSR